MRHRHRRWYPFGTKFGGRQDAPSGVAELFPRRRALSCIGFCAATLALSATGCSPSPGASGQTVVLVDVQKNRRPISPLIYGMCYAGENLEALNCPIHRMGGNNTSRYNWRENADNKGGDWFFESIGEKDATTGGRVDKWIMRNKKAGAQSMVTIPMIGWVAKLGPNRSRTWSFSVGKYGLQEKNDPEKYPDAGNGKKPDGSEMTGNDPKDANLATTPAYFGDWVRHLVTTFGSAEKGGVRYYLLDNEPGLWHVTHRDVRPVGVTMDEQFALMRDTAKVVKDADPTALVCGPEEWGWNGFRWSGADTQAQKAGKELADRKTHGDRDITPWLLQQFAQEERRTGQRLLDVLSVHWYPQGGEFWNANDVSPEMQKKRNRSTRALWDENYKDESWIKETVRLIPRLKTWVAENYPNTKIGLTEYNWGADGHMNGATTQADLLGIFGREGLDIATRWVAPPKDSPVFRAIQMYRNYDGKKGTFGDTGVACEVGKSDTTADTLSAFAATRTTDGNDALTILLVAKESEGARSVRVEWANFAGGADVQIYQLAGEKGKNAIRRLSARRAQGNSVSLTLPAPSVTLLVVPPEKG